MLEMTGLSSPGMLSNLKYIMIEEVEGCDVEFKILRFLLKNAKDLEELVIPFHSSAGSSNTVRQVERFKQKLSAVPTASSDIKLVSNIWTSNQRNQIIRCSNLTRPSYIFGAKQPFHMPLIVLRSHHDVNCASFLAYLYECSVWFCEFRMFNICNFISMILLRSSPKATTILYLSSNIRHCKRKDKDIFHHFNHQYAICLQFGNCEHIHSNSAVVLYISVCVLALGEGCLRANLASLGWHSFDNIEPTELHQKSTFLNWYTYSIELLSQQIDL